MYISAAACMLSAVAISGAVAQSPNSDITTGALGDAIPVTDNPSGAQYVARLPETAFDKAAFPNGGNVNGSIQAVSMPDGHGVMFHVSFSNLPETDAPFIYHIHDQPVPADGNCTGTLAHLDPFQRGEVTPCDPSRPQTCQVGDLSGKHGSISATAGDGGSRTFVATYTDDYASTLGGIGAFFGNRSFVLHFANKTRITCANFTAVGSTSSCGGEPRSTTALSSSRTAAPTSSSSSSSTGIIGTITGGAGGNSSTSRATTRPTGSPATTTTTTGRPTGTGSPSSSASPTFATAAAHAHAPVRELVAGAAALFFLL